MWLIADYAPTTFFSLKPAVATSTGGKTLLCPTPFALKMALLDTAIRSRGVAEGERLFPRIRDLQIALRPPRYAVVNNTFTKILKPRRGKVTEDEDLGLSIALINTIAFREFVQFGGSASEKMELAFSVPDEEGADSFLKSLLPQLNYLGRRGGFFQLQSIGQQSWSIETLRENGYTLLTESSRSFHRDGLLQMLDDCGAKMRFEHANIYDKKRIRSGQERIIHHVVLPYRLARSSKSYSYYQRIEEV